ncbi:mitochondrial 54S ribosomal protein YmL16 [Verticillium alfalfae VaMs.102]|uniref:54S ribosomal protein L6 n=1 Tax=Verticillium alfalfae (strain VaMs.102 / ATCC MYA-4576 / FGSC 10136) TaxID=526221 RepID=C9STF5_VERA1|nr:mitochondrial 54S ribosomal protein YmL16 [Verticillium alfalfae VaMs.102]EEY22070.1 54S ribosomal protein L6 [Verticillium alfalfae VaMs.102]
MFAPGRGLALRQALGSSPSVSLPTFLVPAFQTTSRRQFSASTNRSSKLGRTPLSIPPGVEIVIGEPRVKRDATSYLKIPKRTVSVSGPLGKLDLEIPPFLKIDHDTEARKATLTIEDDTAQLGRTSTATSLASRRAIRRSSVSWAWATVRRSSSAAARRRSPASCSSASSSAFTHPIEEPIPKGVTVTTPTPTRILIEGIDREEIMSFAGRVRKYRPPEPYKGKGVFVNDQTIKLKQKKIK